MSTDLEARLAACAPEPRRPSDIEAVIREGKRRRRRRTAVRSSSSAVVVLMGLTFLASTTRTPAPTAVLQAPSSPQPAPRSTPPAPTGWARVRAGETLHVSSADWHGFPQAAGDLTIDRAWGEAARGLVPTGAASDSEVLVSALAIGPGGAAAFALDDGFGAIIAAPDGAQRVVAEDLSNIAAVWVPAGGWLLLGQDHDGRRVLQRLAPDGSLTESRALRGYPDRVGQRLQVRGEEVWVTAPWETLDSEGPREALLATDGGRTLVQDVSWRLSGPGTADRAPIADAPTRVRIPLVDDVATITMAVGDPGDITSVSATRVADGGGPDVYTVHVHVAPRPVGGATSTEVRSSTRPTLSMVVVAGEEARVARLDASSARDVVTTDHDGDTWFVRVRGDGYRMVRLQRPG